MIKDAALLGQYHRRQPVVKKQQEVSDRYLSQQRLDERKCVLLNRKENWIRVVNESK